MLAAGRQFSGECVDGSGPVAVSGYVDTISSGQGYEQQQLIYVNCDKVFRGLRRFRKFTGFCLNIQGVTFYRVSVGLQSSPSRQNSRLGLLV